LNGVTSPYSRPWAPLALFALIIGVPFVGQAFFSGAYAVFGLLGGDVATARVGFQAFMFWR
jgi:hypothetical protein